MSDTIYRQAAIENVTDEILRRFDISINKAYDIAENALNKLPPAQPNKHLWFMVGETLVSESKRHITAEQAIKRIRQYMQEAQLPSAQPQRMHGRWIKTIGESGVMSAVRCSECGFEDNRYELFRYCPKCGADMREESNGDIQS